jgi:hypothetical protein
MRLNVACLMPEPCSRDDLYFLINREKLRDPYKFSDACYSSFLIVTKIFNICQVTET